jgi:hypothetical protein
VKLDPGLDLVWVGGAIGERRVDLRARNDPVKGQFGGRVGD